MVKNVPFFLYGMTLYCESCLSTVHSWTTSAPAPDDATSVGALVQAQGCCIILFDLVDDGIPIYLQFLPFLGGKSKPLHVEVILMRLYWSSIFSPPF